MFQWAHIIDAMFIQCFNGWYGIVSMLSQLYVPADLIPCSNLIYHLATIVITLPAGNLHHGLLTYFKVVPGSGPHNHGVDRPIRLLLFYLGYIQSDSRCLHSRSSPMAVYFLQKIVICRHVRKWALYMNIVWSC